MPRRLRGSNVLLVAWALAVHAPPPCVAAPPEAVEPGAGEVRGYVLDAEDKPVPGTTVEVVEVGELRSWWSPAQELSVLLGTRSSEPAQLASRAAVRPDGLFVIPELVAGRNYRVVARPTAPFVARTADLEAEVDAPPRAALRLSRGAPLHLRVTGVNGAGVSARIELSPAGWRSGREGWGLENLPTAADGTLNVPAAPVGTVEVEAQAVGLGRVRAQLVVPTAGVATLALADAAGGTLEGTVRDASGNSLAGVGLLWDLEPPPYRLVRVARTDAEGRFRVEQVPAGSARLAEIEALGFQVSAAQRLRWSGVRIAAGGAATVDLRLERTSSIAGTVRDAQGAPAANVEVALAPEPGERSHTKTGADGRYAFTDLGPGQGWVTVTGLDPVEPPRIAADHFRPGARSPYEIVVPGTALVRDFTVKASTLPPLTGIVKDESGARIAGALVTADRWFSDGGPKPTGSVKTGADGRFSLPPPSPYPEWGLGATANGLQSQLEVVRVGGKEAELVLKKQRVVTLAGRILSADDVPLAGAEVTPCQEPASSWGSYSGPEAIAAPVVTDADGRFALKNLGAGTVTLQIEHRGAWLHKVLEGMKGFRSEDLVWHDLSGAEDVVSVVVKGLPTGALSATVVDEDGKPVPGVLVDLSLKDSGTGRFRDATATTDGIGRFHVPYVVAGEYTVALPGESHSSDASMPVVRTGTPDGKIVLKKPPVPVRRAFTGRVVGPGEKPVTLARVNFGEKSHVVGGSGVVIDGRIDALVDLEEGQENATISDARDAAGAPLGTLDEQVPLPPPGRDTLGVIHLRAGGVVSGRVVDASGRGITGVIVELTQPSPFEMHEDELSQPWTLTGDDGAFEFAGLQEWERVLRVHPQGTWVEPERVPLKQGTAEDLRVVLTPGAVIAGRTTNADGAPAQAALNLTWSGAAGPERRRTSTESDGTFLLFVPADAKDVVLRADEGPRAPITIPGWPFAVARDVKPGTRDLVLRMTSGDALTGTVKGPAGEPIASGLVILLPEKDDLPAPTRPFPIPFAVDRVSASIRDGRFEFSTVPAGKRRIVAIPESDEFAPSEVVPVTVPGTGVAVVVPRSIPVAFHLANAGGKSFFAVWSGQASEGNPFWRSASSDADDRFTLRLPPTSAGTLYVRSNDDDRYAVKLDASGATPSPCDLPLFKGLAIRGFVEGLTAGETKDATVLFQGIEVRRWAGLLPDATFEARGLPPGDYEITVEVPGPVSFATSDTPQVVPAGTSDVVISTGVRRVQRR